MAKTAYDTDLDRNPANYQPLTPLTFLERAASVFPDHRAVIHGQRETAQHRRPVDGPVRAGARGVRRG